MNRNETLIKNTALFSLAKLSTSVIGLLLMPIYTNFMSTEEFGYSELVVSLATVIVPFITLGMADASMRFSMDKEYDKKSILSTIFCVLFFGTMVFAISFPILVSLKIAETGFLIYILPLAVLYGTNQILTYQSRGIGRTKEFAISTVISSLVHLLSSILFLVAFDWGKEGYLTSIMFSYLISIIYLFLKCNIVGQLNIKAIKKSIFIELLLYSMPLLLNTLSWSVINYSGRYIINYFCSTSEVGLYSAALKIPFIISLAYSVFTQSWQITATEEYKSKDAQNYFSLAYKAIIALLFVLCVFVMLFYKPLLSVYYGKEFYDSTKYVPVLLIGTIFNCLGGFIGSIYMSAKKTTAILWSTIFSAAVNFIAGIVLVPILGPQGAAIATALSFIALWLYRVFDSKKIMTIKHSYFKIFLSSLVLLTYSYIIYNDDIYQYFFGVIAAALMVFIHYKELLKTWKILKSLIVRRLVNKKV